MIKQVTIHNFQNHVDTTLHLHPNINMIVGSSDHGKSAIIRAINWCRINRPVGSGFVRHSTKETSVSLLIDGKTITRHRCGANENSYKIDSTAYHRVKSDVPVDVTNAINMSDVNVQRQFDTPFAIFDTPGNVAKLFSNTLNLNVMDESVKEANKRLKDVKSQIEILDEEVADIDTILSSFVDVEAMSELVNTANDLVSKLEATESNRAKVAEILFELDTVNQKIQPLPSAIFLDDSLTMIRVYRIESDLVSVLHELTILPDVVEIEDGEALLTKYQIGLELQSTIDKIARIKEVGPLELVASQIGQYKLSAELCMVLPRLLLLPPLDFIDDGLNDIEQYQAKRAVYDSYKITYEDLIDTEQKLQLFQSATQSGGLISAEEIDNLHDLKKRASLFSDVMRQISEIDVDIAAAKTQITDELAKFKGLDGYTCPWCNSKITDEAFEAIVRNYV